MRRASSDRARTLRVWRAHQHLVHPAVDSLCIRDHQPGRFRKGQRVAGCGRPRCHLCKLDKLLGIPGRQQRRSDASYREWLIELGL